MISYLQHPRTAIIIQILQNRKREGHKMDEHWKPKVTTKYFNFILPLGTMKLKIWTFIKYEILQY